MVPWLSKWHAGFGLMGEEGAESIHQYLNKLGRLYCTSADPVTRLHTDMKEHHTHIVPELITARPPSAKRNKET